MDSIRDLYTDAPEEMTISGMGTAATKRKTRDQKADDAEVQDYEERLFVRLPVTAKDRKKRQRDMLRSDLDDTEDFGDIAHYMQQQDEGEQPLSNESSKFLSEMQKVRCAYA